MIRCFFIGRKLYDYMEGGLSEVDRIAVEAHLGDCGRCRQKVSQIRGVLEIAGKIRPAVDEQFWRNFSAGLDRRLDEQLLAQPEPGAVRYRFRPALTYALVLVFVVFFAGLFLKRQAGVSIGREDAALTEQMLLLDQLNETDNLGTGEDALIEDLNYLYLSGMGAPPAGVMLASLLHSARP